VLTTLAHTILQLAAQQQPGPTVGPAPTSMPMTIPEYISVWKLLVWSGFTSLASTVATLTLVWRVVRPHFDAEVMAAQSRQGPAVREWLLKSLLTEHIMARDKEIAELRGIVAAHISAYGETLTQLPVVLSGIKDGLVKMNAKLDSQHDEQSKRMDEQDRVIVTTRESVARIEGKLSK
jgi:hypothetical protein